MLSLSRLLDGQDLDLVELLCAHNPIAQLTRARVRRQKNHSSKLQSADGQLEHDGDIKEPENARHHSIVNLQEPDRCAERGNGIKNIAVAPQLLDYRRAEL